MSAYRDKILGSKSNNIYENLRNKICIFSHNQDRSRSRRFVPTFKEFVAFILHENDEGNRLDEHWAPVYSFCNPCQVKIWHLTAFYQSKKLLNTLLLRKLEAGVSV